MNEKTRVYLECRQPEAGKMRFYVMKIQPGLFGDFALVCEWGRIDHPGKIRSQWFSTETEAVVALMQKQKKKLKRNYRLVPSS